MGLADDLLDQADDLSRKERTKPKQASLRRAVSTAYYALFHLLIDDASNRWSGEKSSRVGLARMFEHAGMAHASRAFQKHSWMGFDGRNVPIPPPIQKIALLFVTLQQDRHRADYNHATRFTRSDVQILVKDVRASFQHWAAIRKHPAADFYLMAMLTGNRRRD